MCVCARIYNFKERTEQPDNGVKDDLRRSKRRSDCALVGSSANRLRRSARTAALAQRAGYK